MVEQLARIVAITRQAGTAQVHSKLVTSPSRSSVKLRCTSAPGLACSTSSHRISHLPRRRQTYEHLPSSPLPLPFPPSLHSLHQTITSHPSRRHPPSPSPRSLFIHPSPVPACPCPTHRPVTRPPPDSPRPRVTPTTHHEHQPRLPTTCRPYPSLHVTAPPFTAAIHFLSTIPSIEPSINVSGSTATPTSRRDTTLPRSKR